MDGEGSLQTQDPLGCWEQTGMKTNARSDSPLLPTRVQDLGELTGFGKEVGETTNRLKRAQDRKESSRNAAVAV